MSGSPGPGGLQAALPKHHYVSAEQFLIEREAVLSREWTCVGRRAELGLESAEQVCVLEVLGESVLLTSDQAGKLHAFYNVCRHRGAQVITQQESAAPSCSAAAALRCPYHSWTYGLDGRLLRAPHADEALTSPTNSVEFGLMSIEIDTWAGFVFVRLGKRAESIGLSDSVAGPQTTLANYRIGELVTGSVLSYDVAANWKVIVENYNECYHCGPVHPELTRLVPAFGGGGQNIDWDAGVPHREGAWTFSLTGTSNREPLPGLDEAERVRHKGELVYPNLMLSASADHIAAFVLRPLAVNRTQIECSLLFHPSAVNAEDFDPSDAADFWDLVNEQDWAICESVQRGMNSRGYTHGWFAPMEDDSADIRSWLLPRLEAEPS